MPSSFYPVSPGDLIESDHINEIEELLPVWGGTSGGTANAQTLTPSVALTAYTAGLHVEFVAGSSNTGACTVNISGLGAKNIYRDGAALLGGEIVSGLLYAMVYDGTQFQLISRAWRGVHAYRSGSVGSIATSSFALEFNAEVMAATNTTIHDPSVNPDRFTADVPGLWRLYVKANCVKNSTGGFSIYLRKNGSTIATVANVGNIPNNTQFEVVFTWVELMAAGDYLHMLGQFSGGTTNSFGGNLSRALFERIA